MLLSILFFVCVALNVCIAWRYLSRLLLAGVIGLGAGLLRVRRYFAVPLSEIRERALRRRVALLLRQLGVVLLGLAAVVMAYVPSMLFAHFHSGLGAAFYSPEGLAGMLAGAAAAWRWRPA